MRKNPNQNARISCRLKRLFHNPATLYRAATPAYPYRDTLIPVQSTVLF